MTGLLEGVPLAVWLLVDAGAVYRLTRLVTRDSLPPAQWIRDRVIDRWGDRALSTLVVCAWCLSFWIGCGVVAARLTVPGPWTALALALTFSAVTGWLSDRE